ncbi:MAG: lytic transglycosylase domain-containing protein [Anaerolineae bacterium]
MARARPDYLQETAAPYLSKKGSGCFSGYVLPPLAVLIVGTLLALFAFNFTPADISAQAQSSNLQTNLLLDSAVGAFIPDPPVRVVGGGSGPFVDSMPRQPAAPPQAILGLAFRQQPVQAAPAASRGLSPIFTPSVQYWSDALTRWSQAAGIDPNLAAVVMQIESCGDPSATSSAGAMGLFQVMPFHFTADDSPYDPDTNALRGLNYLRRSLDAANNDARLAFAGYNGGIGVIGRGEWSWPAETVRYAYWGSGIYADAISGQQESSRLDEWLTAGGRGMCGRANARLGIDN